MTEELTDTARDVPPPIPPEAESSSKPLPLWVWWLLVAAVLAVAAFLRFWMLGRQSLWFDELFTANAALYGPRVAIKVTAQDTNPPLYYVLQSLLMPLIGRTEWALRALSAAVGVLATGVVYLAGRKLFGRATGTWAAAMFAVSILTLQYAQEARMYSLLTLFAALTIWMLGLLAEKPTVNRAVLLGLVLAGLAYTHVYGYMAAPLLLVPVVLVPRLRRRIGKLMLVTYLVAGLLFLPWALVVPSQVALVRGQVASGQWGIKPSVSVGRDFLTNMVAWAPGQIGLPALIFIGLLIAGVSMSGGWWGAPPPEAAADRKAASLSQGAANATAASAAMPAPPEAPPTPDGPASATGVREGDFLWVLVVLAFAPLVAGLLISRYITPIATIRNSLVGLPAAYILAARGGAKLHWPGAVALSLLLVFAAFQLPTFYSDTSKGQWREAAQIILSQPKTGVMTQEWETDFDLEVYGKLLKGEKWMNAIWVDHPNAKPSARGLLINGNPAYSVPKFIWQWNRIYVVSMGQNSSVADYMDHVAGWKLTQTQNLGLPVLRLYTRTDAPKP